MAHTVIQVPVREVAGLARVLTTPPVCPHITLLGPFVDRPAVDDALLRSIRDVLAPARAFDYALTAVGRFPDGPTYLAPDPDTPFRRLTAALAAAFPAWPPYGGAFSDVVPHLSVGDAVTALEVTAIRRLLPVRATAHEVTLTWWSDEGAEVLKAFPLANPT